jgi:hypothetical protein
MIRYPILVLALLLVAIRPAPAQQGNLPKPVPLAGFDRPVEKRET